MSPANAELWQPRAAPCGIAVDKMAKTYQCRKKDEKSGERGIGSGEGNEKKTKTNQKNHQRFWQSKCQVETYGISVSDYCFSSMKPWDLAGFRVHVEVRLREHLS